MMNALLLEVGVTYKVSTVDTLGSKGLAFAIRKYQGLVVQLPHKLR